MSNTSFDPNESAYEKAYQVLNPPNTAVAERRAAERHAFCYMQRIAAYDEQESLDALRFFPVLCHDISRRGISFVLPDRLDFDQLVVELSSGEQRMYYVAKTVNFRYVSDAPH